MKIKASIPSFQQVQVEVAKTVTVSELKRKICGSIDIDPELVRLRANGMALDEDSSLAEAGLDGDTVEVDYLWGRQLLLWGTSGQRRLNEATALIAGAGALGNEVAKNLAMAGVTKMVIVDRDSVELSNTSRMVFFDSGDIGRPKAEVLKKTLEEKFPHLRINAHVSEVERIAAKEWLRSTVILSCLDNMVSRIYIAAAARRYSIPMVDGGIAGYQGRIQTYVPPEDPCPICTIPAENYSQLVGLRNPCDAPIEEVKMPSLPTTVSVVAAIQGHEALKIILGYEEHLKKRKWPEVVGEPIKGVLIMDLKFNRFSNVEAKRNPSCHVCGKDGIACEPARQLRIELEGLKSSNGLEKRVRRLLGTSSPVILLKGEGREKIAGDKDLDDYGLSPGDVIEVIYQVDKNEFKEALIELY